MTSRQNLLPPLTVLDALAYCDGPDAHEARLVTDGSRAVAHLTDSVLIPVETTDEVAVSRQGATVSGGCPALWRGSPCPGTLTWGLDTEGAWTADHAAITLLTTYGTAVER